MTQVVGPLTCSRCGAPLPAVEREPFLLCVYCNTAHRVANDPATASPRVESTAIAEQEVARIRQLIGLGRREEAVAAYLSAAPCPRAEAEAVVTAWGAQLARATPMRATLNGVGWAIYGVALLLVVGGAAAATFELAAPGVAVTAITVGGLVALLFFSALLRTLRYLFASTGTATIVRYALVGQASASVVYRLLIDVRERSGAGFRAEVTMHARTGARVYEGRRFRVKYFRDDPTSILFAGKA